MHMPTRRIEVDTAAISANVRAIRERISPMKMMAVVKADGYGHGLVTAAHAALDGGATWLGVADPGEALRLRHAGVTAPILCWLLPPGADLGALVAQDIEVAVSSVEQLADAAAAGAHSVHMKLDTGLHRNGVSEGQFDAFLRFAVGAQLHGCIVTGAFTHLSNASDSENELQLERFDAMVEQATDIGLRIATRHIGGSHGSLTVHAGRYEMFRVGVACFGIAPEPRTPLQGLGLRPAMRVVASVASTRVALPGAGVSYEYTHRVDRETTLALIPMGYADGVPRSASNRAQVTFRGHRAPIVGRVAMDQFVVDVSDLDVGVGDEVVLWGDPSRGEISAEEWARDCGTIAYELVTRMGVASYGRIVRSSC